MTFLLIGDPHFKTDNAIESEQFCKETIEYVRNSKEIEIVVIMGDILDTHEKIHTLPFCRAVNFILELSRLKKTFLLIGNHDRMSNNDFLSEEHPFIGINNDNLSVVDKVLVYNDYIFVPYVPPGRFKEALNTINYDYKKATAIFAHQEFKGAKMGAIISEKGDIWEKELPPVFSGHIHDFQILENIVYIGTPFQHSFFDSVDKALLKLSFIKSKSKIKINFEWEKIYLENVIKKKAIKLSIKNFLEFDFDNRFLYKVIIEGNPIYIRKELAKPDVISKIKKYNIKYRIKNSVEITKKVSSEKLSVYDCISSFYILLTAEEKTIYHEIF